MAALIINYIFKGKIEKITNIYIHLFQGNIRLLYKIHTLKLLWRAIGKVQIEDMTAGYQYQGTICPL